MEQLAKDYQQHFSTHGKTERECVNRADPDRRRLPVMYPLEKKLASGEKIQAGDKVYCSRQ
ncbi:MAG: hypothetical protein ACLTX6_02075 [Lachnospiraceae bacterium]